jgi:riboflavin kinase/FMN adenylyltransferase
MSSPLHLAIGMFDGVHRGHQAVIRQAMEVASGEEGHRAAVLTFDPHPSKVLYPEMATSLLMPLRQRVQDMHAVGADFVFVQSFTREYARQGAEEFLPSLVKRFPGLKSIHVGENFRFGKGRSGNIDTLRESAKAAGVDLHALERRRMDGLAISSSRIRASLMEGSIDEVNAMLGHPYSVRGRIVSGKGLGRTIDFPTLNIPWCPQVLPRFGVYHVRLRQAGSAVRRVGVANYGLRPTVGESEDPLLEVHLLDNEDIPGEGEPVIVELMRFIRPEKAFDSVDDLSRQISKDVAMVKEIHAAASNDG